MKRIIIFAGLFVGVILGAENIPLDKWSVPEGAWARGEELSITSGGRKHGELMWAPFRKVGKNRVWQLKATIVGKGEIQASLGCYSVDKKRFLTRHPFAIGTKKVNTDFPVEEIWYLTLPENIKEPAGWIRPALRIVSGKFSIRQTQIEAFEKKFDQSFGENAELPPSNISGAKQLQIETPEVSVKVNAGCGTSVDTRVIDGIKYILIRADSEVTVNGIKVNI